MPGINANTIVEYYTSRNIQTMTHNINIVKIYILNQKKSNCLLKQPSLENPKYPGKHLSHLSPPTPGRQSQVP